MARKLAIAALFVALSAELLFDAAPRSADAAFLARDQPTATFTASTIGPVTNVRQTNCNHLSGRNYDMTVAWDAPVSGAQQYSVQMSQDGGSFAPVPAGAATSVTATTDKQSSYVFRVTATWGTWTGTTVSSAALSC